MTDNTTIDKLTAGLKDKLKVDAAPFVPASFSAANNDDSDGKKFKNKAPQKRHNNRGKNYKPKDATKPQQNSDGGDNSAPDNAAVGKESNAKNKGKHKGKKDFGKSKSSKPRNNEKQNTTTEIKKDSKDEQQNDGPGNKEKKGKPSDNKRQPQGKDKGNNNKGKTKAQKKKQNNNTRVDDRDEKQVDDATSKQPQKQDKHKKTAKPNKKSAASSASSASTNKQSIPPNQPQTTNDLNYAAGRPITVVHIAEKPSIGQAIAVGLGGGGNKSYGKSLPVHEFVDNSPFPKAPKASQVTHVVSSVAGHVFNVDFPSEFQSWDTVDPAELFHAPIVKKPCKGSVVKHLQEITKGADFMVLWMDCDR